MCVRWPFMSFMLFMVRIPKDTRKNVLSGKAQPTAIRAADTLLRRVSLGKGPTIGAA